MQGRATTPDFPERASLGSPLAEACQGSSLHKNGVGRSTTSSGLTPTGTEEDSSAVVPPDPFSIAQREAERQVYGYALVQLDAKARDSVNDFRLSMDMRAVWALVLDVTTAAFTGQVRERAGDDPIDHAIDLFYAEHYGAKPV